MDPADAEDTAWTVHTEVFEGPLDLLLYLVRRDGIDLEQFPVSRIAEAYLEYLDRMRVLHLGVAAEYLVMAATLVWLKSLELFQRRPAVLDDEEEAEDPRRALARRLLELQRYREAAERLDAGVQLGREVFVREPGEVDVADRPVASPIDAFGLLDLYYELLEREPAADLVIEVGRRGPDVAGCCRGVLQWLHRRGGEGDLADLLASLPTRAQRVVTFLAVLEMARLQWVDLHQEAHLGPVGVTARVPAWVDLSPITGALQQEAG